MADEVKAYMESNGFVFFKSSGNQSYWAKTIDGKRLRIHEHEATFFFNATRKAKVEVLEAVKRDVVGEDEFHPIKPTNMSSKPWKEVKMSTGSPMTITDRDRNSLRHEQRQALDSMIKANAPQGGAGEVNSMSKNDQPVIGLATPLQPYPKDMRDKVPVLPEDSIHQPTLPNPSPAKGLHDLADPKVQLIERIQKITFNELGVIANPKVVDAIAQAWLEDRKQTQAECELELLKRYEEDKTNE